MFRPAAFSDYHVSTCRNKGDAYSSLERLLRLDFQMRPTEETRLDGSRALQANSWLVVRDNLARVSGVSLPAVKLDSIKWHIALLVKARPSPKTQSEYIALFKDIVKQQGSDDNTISLDPSTASFMAAATAAIYSLNVPKEVKSNEYLLVPSLFRRARIPVEQLYGHGWVG
eukprot:Gregarina_sp_Poly_1__5280@NODE_2798_length_1707_cov_18_690854_g1761_i0_p1_GENE_NODE_2798_length_1707_cov_18_690854_g1761_i0NODE_2798_length_1707_cov_18_690854_g1761_i0_p1_ORF_typecomplete_len171_score20_04_NODE_2798_length_1707_cov_18_690854_g1761_i09621474